MPTFAICSVVIDLENAQQDSSLIKIYDRHNNFQNDAKINFDLPLHNLIFNVQI